MRKPNIKIAKINNNTLYLIHITSATKKYYNCLILANLKRTKGITKRIDWSKDAKNHILDKFRYRHSKKEVFNPTPKQLKKGQKIWQRINEEIIEEQI